MKHEAPTTAERIENLKTARDVLADQIVIEEAVLIMLKRDLELEQSEDDE